MDPSISAISLLQLLTHTSGLPRLPENFIKYYSRKDNPYIYYGEPELLEYLGEAKVKVGCKTTAYSNLGYGLLGYLLGEGSADAFCAAPEGEAVRAVGDE